MGATEEGSDGVIAAGASHLLSDVRHALKGMARRPSFAAVVLASLALGIGLNTAILSLLDQVLLRPLPLPSPDELVLLSSPGPKEGHTWSDGDESESFSAPMYRALSAASAPDAELVGRFGITVNLVSDSGGALVQGELVSGNYFDALRVRASLGRGLSPADDRPGAPPVAVLSDGYLKRRFGGDPGVVGRTLVANGTPLTIVGVAQGGFSGIELGQPVALFVPLQLKARMTPNWDGLTDWSDHWLAIMGRLGKGTELLRAEAHLNVVYKGLLEESLKTTSSRGDEWRRRFLEKRLVLSEGGRGRATLRRDRGDAFLVVALMTSLLVLAACANVANLLLARGVTRQRELSVRAALGASAWQLVRPLLVESALFTLIGTALGLLFASYTLSFLVNGPLVAASIEGLSPRLDARTFTLACLTSLVALLVFGATPAIRAARAQAALALKGASPTTSASREHVRFRRTFAAAQVALTVVLLGAAFLFTRTLRNLRHLDLGVEAEKVVSFSLSPALDGYTPARTAALAEEVVSRLRATSGVEVAGAAMIPILADSSSGSDITLEKEGAQREPVHVNRNWVGPGYFQALGIPLLAGRAVEEEDTSSSSRVAVVNELFVRKFLSSRDAVGVHFQSKVQGGLASVEIVGVCGSAREEDVRKDLVPFMYFPLSQNPTLGAVTFYARTREAPGNLAPALRQLVRDTDSTLPVHDLATLASIVDDDMLAERAVAWLSIAFGALAALLAALGLYGVVSYLVLQRTREIGIRMVLGAGAPAIRAMVFREVASMVVLGATAGLPAAYALGRIFGSLLYGVEAGAPSIYTSCCLLVGAVGAAAGYLPARRALCVDPVSALRQE